jgi:hypothetical protein
MALARVAIATIDLSLDTEENTPASNVQTFQTFIPGRTKAEPDRPT